MKDLARIVTLALVLLAGAAHGEELRFARHFTDNMVLQRDKAIRVRGSAAPGKKLKVSFGRQSGATTADESGMWEVVLEPLQADNRPGDLVVKAGWSRATIKNVVVGDVILHARQTSIDISLGRDDSGKKVASSHRASRMFRAISIKTVPSDKPLGDLVREATTGWSVVDERSALTMTASAYHLGAGLARDSDVPVGIIDLNLGSAFANSWLSRRIFLDTENYYDDREVASRVEKAEKILTAERKGEKINRRHDGPPKDTIHRTLFPYAGYNGTLLPLSGTALKAVVLQLGNDYPYMIYQQILDSDNPFDRKALSRAYDSVYDIRKVGFRMESKTIPRIVREWRKYLGDRELPFGLVVPPGSDLNTLAQHHREMRELQRLVSIDNAGVGIILPGTENITFSAQPADEELLAKRCLSWVNGAVYEMAGVAASGPAYDRFEARFNEATIYYKEGTAHGLKADGDALDYFEAANVEGEYYPVTATVDGETIRIKSDDVTRIMRIRYNWNRRPNQGLVNSAGLPAIPFRTERATHHYLVRNDVEDLPEEYFMPANQWKKSDVTLINVALQGSGYSNFTGWIGPAGFRAGPFGPNMGVREIKKGSPADGKLLVGDAIYSANGRMLGEKAWLVMASAITDSETTGAGGELVLGVRRGTENIEVVLSLEVMGTYSSTAPYDCPKTERIISNLEKWVVARGGGAGFLNYDAAFLMSTGRPELQGYVRRAVYKILEKPIPETFEPTRAGKSWHNSAEAFLLGEYYMATGDRNVLPHLKYACDRLAATQSKPVGGWRHNFPGGASYGMIPNAGLPGVMGMFFAKEAGLDIDMECYKLAVYHFTTGRAETGTMIYGNQQHARPPRMFSPSKMANGMMDTYNGGVSSSGILMGFEKNDRAAHICSAISTYAFSNTHVGHGGNFWNNFWTPLGAHQHGKEPYVHFWKNHRWYRECSRMFDGELIGGGRSSAGYGIALTAPRKRLQIVGAPPSPFGSSAPEMLKPALEAYWNRDYASAERLVRELIAGGSVSRDDSATVEFLARAAKEMQQSIEADLKRMMSLIDAGDEVAAKTFLPGLIGVMAPGDARLVSMKQRLDGVVIPPKSRKRPPKKQMEETREWRCLVMDRQVKDPARIVRKRQGSVVTSKLDRPSVWKLKVLESVKQAPPGWYEPGFDDTAWLETELPISWRMYHTALLRMRFNVEDKSQFDALRLHAWVLRQQGIMIYLNGELISKINSSGKSTEIQYVFKDSAMKHLRNGENTLSISTRHNWRWGRSFMYVYNDGFDFNLDARLAEE